MKHRVSIVAALALSVASLGSMSAAVEDRCDKTRAKTFVDATGRYDAAGEIRVYAMQFKQEVRHVETYAAFRHKMRCMVEELVLPDTDKNGDGLADRPTIVVFNEDIGLATIATGSRGAAARAIATHAAKDPQGNAGAQAAFATLAATHATAVDHYRAQEPDTSVPRLVLAAATDTFARGFMQTFSDLAKDYGIYVVASNNQAEFRETSDPATVARLADPDLAPRYATGALKTVYEAVDSGREDESVGTGRAGIDVYNQAWLWAPTTDVTPYAKERFRGLGVDGADIAATDPRANIIAVNKKTPITSVEVALLDLSDDRDMSVANTGPFYLPASADPSCVSPGPSCKIKIGFGISLPSFMWGPTALHQPLPSTTDPCGQPTTWMRCLDARGVTLFLQPEANPGPWAEYNDVSWRPTAFQSLSWMDSAWRAVADTSVSNIRYAVTPHLVGNLVDLAFDGQSAIMERCLPRGTSTTCAGNVPQAFVGAHQHLACNGATERCDDPRLAPYAGEKINTMIVAPWVLDPDEGQGLATIREELAARARAMIAGSGAPQENDYLETAIWADLDFD